MAKRTVMVSEFDDGRFWAEVVSLTDETGLVEELHHATGFCATAKDARTEARAWMRAHPAKHAAEAAQ